jgi:hypothetical protein
MRIKYTCLIFLILFIKPMVILSQNYHRFEANISIKTLLENGKGTLEMGKVYFDKNSNSLIYDFAFPEKFSVLLIDSNIIVVKNKEIVSNNKGFNMVNHSIYNAFLNNQWNTYGMSSNSIYKISKIEKEEDLLVTTWSYKGNNNIFGEIKTAIKNRMLYSVIIFDRNNKVTSKQFFENYKNIDGLNIPTEIIQIYYKDAEVIKQVITYSTIILNNETKSHYYNYNYYFK